VVDPVDLERGLPLAVNGKASRLTRSLRERRVIDRARLGGSSRPRTTRPARRPASDASTGRPEGYRRSPSSTPREQGRLPRGRTACVPRCETGQSRCVRTEAVMTTLPRVSAQLYQPVADSRRFLETLALHQFAKHALSLIIS